jgi:hypothetical protein
MSAFQSITPLGTTATFLEWFNSYNSTALGKLNSIYISRPYAGDGITLGYNSTSGGYTFELSGNVTKNMSFAGDVVFNGNVSLASAQLSGVAFGVSGNYIGIGVTAGKVVKVLNTGGITLAKADSPDNAEVLGIAVSVDTTKTVIAIAGKISGSTLATNLISGGFSAGCVYFLDPTVAGGLTRTEPTTIGQVSKPVLIGLSGSEAALLPYRGQYINGISGSSGEVTFNSTLYVTVKSQGESEANFSLRPGYLMAAGDKSSPEGITFYEGLGSNFYYKALNSTPTEKILGLVGSYVGSYSNVNGTNVVLKVYPTTSVVTDVISLNNWSSLSSAGIVYLSGDGTPSTTSSSPELILGNISNTDLLLNIQSLSQTIYSSVGSGVNTTSNILMNGQHHLWQRARGVTAPYGITTSSGEIKKNYLADKFVMWAGSNTIGFTAQRQNFSDIQTDVQGYPKYYVTMRKTSVSGSKSYYYSVVDDVRTIANKQLTLSLYARTPGGTGTFKLHSIQNIALSPSGNTYLNGVTHSTVTTSNSNWNRYSVTFIGPTAGSGITNSYSLVGVELVDEGKTFDFAQFILNEGATAIAPKIVDMFDEYQRVAPYYQRSYRPDEMSGSSVASVNNGINQSILPPFNRIFYTLKYPMKKIPNVTLYSVGGKANEVSIAYGGAYFDISNPVVLSLPTYGGCARSSIPSLTTYTSAINTSYTDFYFSPSQNYCPFDEVAFHYVADADITIN